MEKEGREETDKRLMRVKSRCEDWALSPGQTTVVAVSGVGCGRESVVAVSGDAPTSILLLTAASFSRRESHLSLQIEIAPTLVWILLENTSDWGFKSEAFGENHVELSPSNAKPVLSPIRSTIRHKIIPHAESWFIGEAIQGEFGHLEGDEDEDIVEDEEEEEEDDGDEDEDDDND
ncbi:hypothetical protein K1719_032686 [Acacia pycnantha]|nr:hypothetical protein K1719_032686 [Acacia pycnantha]